MRCSAIMRRTEGYKKVITIVPNYQAGRDAVAGFKRDYKGEVPTNSMCRSGSSITPPSWLASPRPSRMRCSPSSRRHGREPSSSNIRQAGLTIPVLSAFTVDESTLPAQGDAALGMLAGSNWAPNLDNAGEQGVRDAFEAEYHYVPATYAFQAFDAAMMIDVRGADREGQVG